MHKVECFPKISLQGSRGSDLDIWRALSFSWRSIRKAVIKKEGSKKLKKEKSRFLAKGFKLYCCVPDCQVLIKQAKKNMDCGSMATSVVGKAGELMVPSVSRQLSFLFFYKKHIDDLKDRIPELEGARSRLQQKIKAATDNLEKIYDTVELWMMNASNLVEEAQRFIAAEAEANKTCCNGWFPNLVSRHQLARKAYKAKLRVVEMSDREPGKSGDEVSYTPEKQFTIDNEGYQVFETRSVAFESIKSALKSDDKTRMILIYGMAGTGKTMLAKEIGKKTREENIFHKVIFTAVSQSPDYKRIQDEIGGNLGLKALKHKDDLEERARLIRERLGQENNILVILDDIWKELELSKVGIFFQDSQVGCKILVTSRFEKVLINNPHSTRKIGIGLLSEQESMRLFNNIVGDKAQEYDFKKLAIEIVHECGRLPLALNVVASALRNEELDDWKDALNQLKRSDPVNIEGMSDIVFNSIKLSYNFLRHEEAQKLFLLFSVREEDADMILYHYLMYAYAWGLFRNVYTFEEARCRFNSLVNKLRAHSLLIEGNNFWSVKMHDVIRDFGIYTASNEKEMYFITNDELQHCSRERRRLQNSKAFTSSGLNCLPTMLECPQVELILLDRSTSVQISDRFFEQAKKLKILSFAYSSIQGQLSSLRPLENLQMLCLHCSFIHDITVLGELKNLEFLELCDIKIAEVPKEIGQLTQLRLLDVRNCRQLEVIQPYVLSKLTLLEELNMSNTFIEWEVEGVRGGMRKNASLSELKGLPRLQTLHLHVSSDHVLSADVLRKKFLRYEISIHRNGSLSFPWLKNKLIADTIHTTKILRLDLETCHLIEKLGVEMLLESCEELQLIGLEGVNSLVPEINGQGFPQLKHLAFQQNAQVQYMVNSVQEIHSTTSVFEQLESLRLVCLTKLESICRQVASPDSFGRLQELVIYGCSKLRNLFTFPIAKNLLQLKLIEVKNCDMIEEIVTHDGPCFNGDEIITLPQLHSMILKGLPKLLAFCSYGFEPSQTNQLPLFSGKNFVAPKLAELQVVDCGALRYLFSTSFAMNLMELRVLQIHECNMVKEIMIMDHNMEEVTFPQLGRLGLVNLPNLKKFCSGIFIKIPWLTGDRMWECKFQGGAIKALA